MSVLFEKASFADLSHLKKLWLETFSEKPKAVDLFFCRNINNMNIYCAKTGDKIVSALYLLDCSLNEKKAHYLCGASTKREFRRRGIMTGLIKYALDTAKKEGDCYSLLFPANQSEKLYSFYGRLGYLPNCTAKTVSLSREELVTDKTKTDEKPDYQALQKQCFGNNFLLWNNDFIDFVIEYYKIYNIKAVFNQNAFALIEESKNNANVFYCIYKDFDSLKALLLKNTASNHFVLTVNSNNSLFPDIPNQKYGMIKTLDEKEKTPNDVYVGLTLN